MRRITQEALFGWVFLAYFALVLVLGGNTSGAPIRDTLIQLTSVPISVLALWKLFDRQIRPAEWRVMGILFLLLGLIGWQLIPLPPDIWASLPGRGQWSEGLKALGLPDVWRPASLVPDSTILAAMGCLPVIAVVLSVCHLNQVQRQRVVATALCLGLLSVVLGAFQLAASVIQSGWQEGEVRVIGFFANRNTWAVFMASLIPLAGYWLIASHVRASPKVVVAANIGFLLLATGIGISASRSGLILLGFVCLGCGIIWAIHNHDRGDRLKWGGAILASFALSAASVAYLGGWRALERFTGASDLEGRFVIWQLADKTITAFWPLGAGSGTFGTVARLFEQTSSISQGNPNQAHNEYLSLAAEHGIPGIIVAVIILLGIVWGSYETLTTKDIGIGSLKSAKGAMAFLILCLVTYALHSIVEYPLRPASTLSLFVLVYCLASVPPLEDDKPRHRAARLDKVATQALKA